MISYLAIREERKRNEIRTNTPYSPFDYTKVKSGDVIEFINKATGEALFTQGCSHDEVFFGSGAFRNLRNKLRALKWRQYSTWG